MGILKECNLGSLEDLAYSYKERNKFRVDTFLHSTSGHHSQTSHMFFIHNKVQRNAAKLRESACLAEIPVQRPNMSGFMQHPQFIIFLSSLEFTFLYNFN